MSGPTDLGRRFRRLIEGHGPIPVARFMGESNALYYATRDPLGAPNEAGGGDFITAPDVSQMFGEMIGLWLTDLWDRAGRPDDVAYVELGPGRGTLARDALRAMAPHGLAPPVHFVEGSPALRSYQRTAVPGAVFHDDPASLPDDAPLLLVANEFLDALPVRQLVRTEGGWRERMIGMVGDRLAFVAGDQPMEEAVPASRREAPPGTIIETSPAAATIVEEVARRLAMQGGAALFVDYGSLAPLAGSSLQAVKRHRKVDPLAFPGEADLTAHVDFATLAEVARRVGITVMAATQGAFLGELGIAIRAQALAAATPDRAEEIDAALARLVGPDQMGALFKVMALNGGSWQAGVGFAGSQTVASPSAPASGGPQEQEPSA